jgi:hypothetical protein
MESWQYSLLPFTTRMPGPGRLTKQHHAGRLGRGQRAVRTSHPLAAPSSPPTPPLGNSTGLRRPRVRQKPNAPHIFSVKRPQHRRYTAVSGAATLSFAFSSPQSPRVSAARVLLRRRRRRQPVLRGPRRGARVRQRLLRRRVLGREPPFPQTARGARLA